MWKWLFLVLVLALVGAGAFVYVWTTRQTGTPSPGPKGLPVSADVVPADVALYVSVHVAELWDSPMFASLRETPKEGPTDALTKAFGLVELDMADLDAATYVVPSDPKLPHAIVAAGRKPFAPAAAAERLRAEVRHPDGPVVGAPKTIVYSCKGGGASFAGVEGLLVHVKGAGKGLNAHQWADLFRLSLGAHRRAEKLRAECVAPIVFAVSGSGARQALPVPVRGPDRFAGYRNLLRMEVGVVAVTVGDALTVRARARFPEGAAADAAGPQAGELARRFKQIAATLQHDALDRGTAGEEAAAVPELIARLMENVTVGAEGTDLVGSATVPIRPNVTAALAAFRRDAEEADRRSTALSRFREIGIAAVGFADRSDNKLPNNIYGADGEPLLSWRVALLPDLGYADVYKQFHLQDPWDSDHNKKLLAAMPDVFSLPGAAGPEPGRTFIQGFVGPAGVNPRPVFVRGDRQGISLEIPDGTSNTALCVEAAEAVPWTKPEDVEFDPKKPPRKLGGHYGPRAIILFLDGSARLAPLSSFTENAVRGLATINGNERFEFP